MPYKQVKTHHIAAGVAGALPWVLLAVALLPAFCSVAAAQQPSAQQAPAADTSIGTSWQTLFKGETLWARLAAFAAVILVSLFTYVVVMVALRRMRRRLEAQAAMLEGAHRSRHMRAVTVVSLIANVARWLIFVMATLWALGALGLNLAPALTGIGLIGAALAFGSQKLVSDVVSGLFLLLEGTYSVGDWVMLGTSFGMVEEQGLRVTVLRDISNQLFYVPNGSIIVVTVYEKPEVPYALETPVATAEAAAALQAPITQLGRELQAQYPRYLPQVGEAQVSPPAQGVWLVRLPLSVFPGQEWLVNEALPARLHKLLGDQQVALHDGLDVRAVKEIVANT